MANWIERSFEYDRALGKALELNPLPDPFVDLHDLDTKEWNYLS